LIKLFIIRHGVAADLDHEIADESYRYLTVHGRNHCKIIADKLRELKVSPDIIISSPLVRAVQTAEIFASVLGYKNEIKTAIELIGGSPFSRFLSLIRRNSHYGNIALVGHAPDVNEYSHNLVKESSPAVKFNFKNSSVCRIDYDIQKESGKFIWFLDSEKLNLIQ
jgi:phosphohistidine phosphatase